MRAALAFCFIAAAVSVAHAGVTVSFAERQRMSDVERRDVAVRQTLRAHLQRLGAGLDRGLDLHITVLDIDLAGWDASSRGPSGLRIMTGATWPKIRLRYVLTKNRRTIAAGEELLTDHFYRSRPGTASTLDPLRYEKNMLNDWFLSRFASHLRRGS